MIAGEKLDARVALRGKIERLIGVAGHNLMLVAAGCRVNSPRRVGLGLMATFVLIHGSYQGGWIWKPVSALLSAAGHAVYRPTLDGCAERKGGLRREITLATNGHEIANLLFYEDLQDVVFVGTSSGGMVVCQAAEQVPERIRRLIFIDALVPVPGETVATIRSQGAIQPR